MNAALDLKASAALAARPIPFLEVRDVHKRFGGVHALRGVSLSIQRGEIYHLLGENGCGKSTLIKIISGAQPPDEGELLIDGEVRAGLNAIGALSAGIETVYQDLSLLPNLSVAENVALSEQLVLHGGQLNRRLDRAKLAATASRALEAVKLPTHTGFLSTAASALPIAVRQLVAIARAIATRARLVIMDEPTTALTRREIENLSRVVRGLSAQGVAVLFVSHKLDECIALGGEAVVMRDGQKVVQGPIREFTNASLAHWMTGKTLEGQRLRGAARPGAELLSVRELGRRGQFSDITFDLRQGEILGITGLLDSGRNELALALAGVAAADHGQIGLDGRTVSLRTTADAIAHRIGYVPEDRLAEGLFLDKPIRDNVITAVLHKVMGRLGLLDVGKARVLAETAVADLHIAAPSVLTPVQSLSGGNQQRVLIGRWLAIDPRVLILHGPTVGVDVGSKDTIYRIIQRLTAVDAQGRSSGVGVIIISDDLPELLQNCDRILLMSKGRITQSFDAARLTEADLYAALVADAQDTAAKPPGERPPPPPSPGRWARLKTAFVARPSAFTLLLIALVSLAIGSINPVFFQVSTLFDMARSATVTGLFALGVFIVLAAGGIDVSFTAIAALTMYALTKAVILFAPGMPMAFILLVGALGGAALGAVNGLLVHRLNAPSLIVTIGTQYLFRGALLTFIGTAWISVVPAQMESFGQLPLAQYQTAEDTRVVLPAFVLLLAAAAWASWWLLNRTLLGRAVFALGGSLTIAERLGYDLRRVHLFVFGYAGLLAGLAGVVHVSSNRLANPFDLVGSEIGVIAAVVLGGARISGGSGTVMGTLLGVILVTLVNNTLILAGVPSTWQRVVVGSFILLAGMFFAIRKPQ